MSGHSQGGDDTFTGGVSSTNNFIGDVGGNMFGLLAQPVANESEPEIEQRLGLVIAHATNCITLSHFGSL